MAGGGKHTRRGGGGGGTPRPGTGGPGTTNPDIEDPCDIAFETILNSVDPLAVQDVSRGNRLPVTVDNTKPRPRLQVTYNGRLVGVISNPKTLDVIACIGQGNEYVAIVLDRKETMCKVKIERQEKKP